MLRNSSNDKLEEAEAFLLPAGKLIDLQSKRKSVAPKSSEVADGQQGCTSGICQLSWKPLKQELVA